ncbi:MAG: SseB family protein [Lactobacillaceae bacterium]|jgi:hypothetical protein|nr:SseB family protein [Lactobacillaceae bacterium]
MDAIRIYFNEPVDNADLDTTLTTFMADSNPDTEHDFIHMLAVSKLYAPVQVIGAAWQAEADGSQSIEYAENVEVQYQVIKNGTGKLFFPAFTNQAEYDKWAATSQAQGLVTSLLSYDQFSALTLPNDQIEGIVVNPLGDNVVLDKTNLQYITDMVIQMNSEASIHLEDTLTEQAEFKALLARDLPNNLPAIKTVWAVDLVRGAERSLVYVLDADNEAANAEFFAYAQVSGVAPDFSNVMTVGQVGYPRIAEFAPIYNN